MTSRRADASEPHEIAVEAAHKLASEIAGTGEARLPAEQAWSVAMRLTLLRAALVPSTEDPATPGSLKEVWKEMKKVGGPLLEAPPPGLETGVQNTALQQWRQRTAQLSAELKPADLGELYARMLGLTESWEDASDSSGRYGRRRKERGVYVTPPLLAARLIEETVQGWSLLTESPLLEKTAGGALVCDPACGGGALLLAWLGQASNMDERDARAQRVFGVDVDSLAVELCRLALWIASGRSERTRTTLAAQIVVGDALFGQGPNGAPPITVPWRELQPQNDTLPMAGSPQPIDWSAQWPEATERGGFDLILVNPPWERVKAQARDLLRWTHPDAAAAAHKGERDKLLAGDAVARQRLSAARALAAARSTWLRKSGAYPWAGRGDVNLYPVFVERCWHLTRPGGRVGAIVPTGMTTDYGHRYLFGALVERNAVRVVLDFENRRQARDADDQRGRRRPRWFQAVDSRFRFSLIALEKPLTEKVRGESSTRERSIGERSIGAATFLREPEEADVPGRRWRVTADEVALLNPESKTLPLFRDERAAMRGLEVVRRARGEVGGAIGESGGADGEPVGWCSVWDSSFERMFDMTNDADAFRTAASLEGAGAALGAAPGLGLVYQRGEERWLPLLEGKLFWLLDPAWSSFEEGAGAGRRARAADLPVEGRHHVRPRYWVPEERVRESWALRPVMDDEAVTGDEGEPPDCWLCIRALTNPTNERTLVPALVPPVGVGNSALIVHSEVTVDGRSALPLLAGNLASVVLDDLARQKMGNTNVNMFHLRQLPLLPPSAYSVPLGDAGQTAGELVAERVLGLSRRNAALTTVGTGWGDVAAIVQLSQRRRALAELDAVFAILYGLSASELEDLLEPPAPLRSFDVWRRKELSEYGEFAMKRMILSAFQDLQS